MHIAAHHVAPFVDKLPSSAISVHLNSKFQLSEIKTFKMKYNKTSARDRQRIIEAFNNEEDWKKVANALGVNAKTAYRWLKNKQVFPKKKGGNNKKKCPEILRTLTTAIEENVSITLSQLRRKVQHDHDIDVCVNTIKNWLDGEMFSVKLVRPSIDRMNNEENKGKRARYMEQFFNARSEGRTPVWVDETNFNLYCKRNQGRSKVGTRASVILPSSKGANLHIIGAMTSTQLLLTSTRRGSFKRQDCLQWFRELIDACRQNGIDHPTFIIDNAPAHNNLEELETEYPTIQILRLAPYSYLLNPIELLWSLVKSHVKRHLRERMHAILEIAPGGALPVTEQRMREMENIAVEALGLVNPGMLLNFTNRVEKYYAAATRQEDLIEIC